MITQASALSLNASEDLPSDKDDEGIRCFCNLPQCVETSYLCKSEIGLCFTKKTEPDRTISHEALQVPFAVRTYVSMPIRGCADMLPTVEQLKCRRVAYGKNFSANFNGHPGENPNVASDRRRKEVPELTVESLKMSEKFINTRIKERTYWKVASHSEDDLGRTSTTDLPSDISINSSLGTGKNPLPEELNTAIRQETPPSLNKSSDSINLVEQEGKDAEGSRLLSRDAGRKEIKVVGSITSSQSPITHHPVNADTLTSLDKSKTSVPFQETQGSLAMQNTEVDNLATHLIVEKHFGNSSISSEKLKPEFHTNTTDAPQINTQPSHTLPSHVRKFDNDFVRSSFTNSLRNDIDTGNRNKSKTVGGSARDGQKKSATIRNRRKSPGKVQFRRRRDEGQIDSHQKYFPDKSTVILECCSEDVCNYNEVNAIYLESNELVKDDPDVELHPSGFPAWIHAASIFVPIVGGFILLLLILLAVRMLKSESKGYQQCSRDSESIYNSPIVQFKGQPPDKPRRKLDTKPSSNGPTKEGASPAELQSMVQTSKRLLDSCESRVGLHEGRSVESFSDLASRRCGGCSGIQDLAMLRNIPHVRRGMGHDSECAHGAAYSWWEC